MKLYKEVPAGQPYPGQADPYMIQDGDGRFYLYTTGGNLFCSDKLLEGWRYEGVCLQAPEQHNVWAPSVICLDGTYYMHYSSLDSTADDDHGQTMRVAVSDSPKGPFLYQQDVLKPFSIDPHMVKTPSGLYFFYCVNDAQAERPGTLVVCDKMQDAFTPQGNPKPVIVPSIDEEIFQRDRFQKGQHWHTIEGPFYFFRDGFHYLMYSGACYQNPTYFIGYSIAEGPQDADLRELPWEKYPSADVYAPLMQKNGFVEGVGHNSVISCEGNWYVVYHGRAYGDNSSEDTRVARIDQLHFDGKKLSVEITP